MGCYLEGSRSTEEVCLRLSHAPSSRVALVLRRPSDYGRIIVVGRRECRRGLSRFFGTSRQRCCGKIDEVEVDVD